MQTDSGQHSGTPEATKTAATIEAEQIAAQYGINVYPNPLMDGKSATISISSKNSTTAEEAIVNVLDNNGKVLFTEQIPSLSGITSREIDLSKYASGIYYFKVSIGKEQLFYKVTKVQ